MTLAPNLGGTIGGKRIGSGVVKREEKESGVGDRLDITEGAVKKRGPYRRVDVKNKLVVGGFGAVLVSSA